MTNEPTTGEIVRALGNPETLDQESLYYWSKVAADRLESQAEENEINRHLIEMQSNVITELTARAESAERERDAAIADLKNAPRCSVCDHQDCKYCTGNDMFTWRGLQPQDGGGK